MQDQPLPQASPEAAPISPAAWAAVGTDPWEGLSPDDRMLHPDWQLARIRGRLIDAGNALAVQYLLEARMRMTADEQTAEHGEDVHPLVGMAMRHNWLRTRALAMPDMRFLSPWVRWMM